MAKYTQSVGRRHDKPRLDVVFPEEKFANGRRNHHKAAVRLEITLVTLV